MGQVTYLQILHFHFILFFKFDLVCKRLDILNLQRKCHTRNLFYFIFNHLNDLLIKIFIFLSLVSLFIHLDNFSLTKKAHCKIRSHVKRFRLRTKIAHCKFTFVNSQRKRLICLSNEKF